MRPTSLFLLVLLLVLPPLFGGCGDGIQRDSDGTPTLVSAAERGDLDQMRDLLADGTPVDVRDICLRTPLMLAAQQGRFEAVQELLNRGAFANLHGKGHYTALMLAASNDHHQIVRLLAEHGADVNERERTRGWTALIWAAKRGHVQTVRVLLELGADPMVSDDSERTAELWARAQRHRAVLAELVDDKGLRQVNAH